MWYNIRVDESLTNKVRIVMNTFKIKQLNLAKDSDLGRNPTPANLVDMVERAHNTFTGIDP